MLASHPRPVLLSAADIRSLIRPPDWIAAAEAAFRAAGEGRVVSPLPLHVAASGGGFHAKAALLQGEPFFALKLNGNFPGNRERGLPTIQGVLVLCSAEDGSVLALFDSGEVTLQRTAAATAVAAARLARPGSATITVCGCGAQGAAQLAMLAALLPLRRAFLWDVEPERARTLAGSAPREVAAAAVRDLRAAARASDIIVCCTTASRPYLGPEHVSAGAFVAAVGADNPDKAEIEPALMAAARVVTDSTAQCVEMGDLRAAVATGAVAGPEVCTELGEIVAGRAPGRKADSEIIVFDSTGTAVQDLTAAVAILERVRGGPVRRP